ncbi:amino acid ABC transporter permease [Undibacter mobilis]|uniref:Amino acid ABC transporter permease n=1 Tax=Undibacter mobilis TaxID=2292256 RepID=A0A371BAU2_9BRAD|nr:amino acid ABC transporter permease [Undibacter mobilis]RDV04690.1 amino acid ABC transporter permease [Undibacter mobilis]
MYYIDWRVVWDNLPRLADGIVTALELVVVAGFIAFFVGILGALARRSKFRSVRVAAIVYLEAVRNSPVLVKMYFIYFGLPTFDISLSPFVSGAVALGLHHGAYLMEIFRAAFDGVPRGQFDGAASLGLPRWLTFWKIELPQALRAALPPVGNVGSELIKDTSLTSSISLAEAYFVFVSIIALTMRTVEIFVVAAGFYLAVTWIFSLGVSALERRLNRPYGPRRTAKAVSL